MVEDNSILENNYKIGETFNNFFPGAVSNLNIPQFVDPSVEIDYTEDPILRIIEQYKNHPSVVAIKKKYLNKQFSVQYIPKSGVKKEILNLDISKASQDSDITAKSIKMNADIFPEILYVFNRSLEVGEFPYGMKLANVTPVHKKGNRYCKGNYRPISILPNLSKVFERCLHKQIFDFFFDNVLLKYQCGFRKGHGAQHCLMTLLKKWPESIDRGPEFGILLTDFSKAFDCLPHDLLFVYYFYKICLLTICVWI